MIANFYKGFCSPIHATFYVLRTPVLWRHIILPVLFMGLCLVGGVVLLFFSTDSILLWLSSFGVHPPSTTETESWLTSAQGYLIYYGSIIGIWVLGIFFSYMLAVIVAPMLSEPIAEHVVEKKSWGDCIHEDATPQSLSAQIGESVLVLFAQSVVVLFGFFWGLIPVLGLLAPIFVAGCAVLVLSKELLDVPLVRHGIPLSRKIQIIRSKPSLFMGFGFAVLVMAMIPLYNFVLFPIAVVSVTHLFYEEVWPVHKNLLVTREQ